MLISFTHFFVANRSLNSYWLCMKNACKVTIRLLLPCSIDASSPWSAYAAATLTDALPSLWWRMLCRPFLARSGGYFAALVTLWRMLCRRVCAAVWSSLADDSPLWSCLFWWMLGHSLVVFVVCWRPRCCCSSCRFICVRCFVGLGGLVRSSALWSSFC